MLYLIGLGLNKKDISMKALETVKKCSKVYLESYTNIMPYSAGELEKVIGKKIISAERKFVEEKDELIEEAKKQKIALLVSGDPLSATTHIDLLLRAKKAGVKTAVIHAPSVLTAIAETGLQLYKFGKTGSIAKWKPSFKPESFYDILIQNRSIDAHTLLLLDIGLSVREALSYIDSIARTKDIDMLNKELIVCENLGEKQKFTVGTLYKLQGKKFSLPTCIIVPGKLHFVEAEFLEILRKKG